MKNYQLFSIIFMTFCNAQVHQKVYNYIAPNESVVKTEHYVSYKSSSSNIPVASLHEEDSYDDMLSNAVQQMWKNGLRNLKKKLAFNTAQGNQNYVQFSISTYCYSNGTCTIRQAPCSCEINDNDETLGNVKPNKNIINQGKSQKTTTKIPLTTLISKKQKVQNNKTTNIPPITPSSKKKKVQNNGITKRPLITLSTTQHKVQNKKTTTKPPIKSTQSNKLIGGLTNFEINNIRKQHLEQTNKLRAKHGAKKLSINEKMNTFAQDWAIHLAKSNKFEHRPKSQQKYGENLFASTDIINLGRESASDWYDEINANDGFNFKGSEKSMADSYKIYGHMTQLLWKNSKEIGIGVSKGSNGMYIIVTNYYPSGNVVGQFKKNVSPK